MEKIRSTQGVILGLLEKAKDPSSKLYLSKLLENTKDNKFKERVNKVLNEIK